MKFMLPTPHFTRSTVMRLYRDDAQLQEQQTVIRDQLVQNRVAKEAAIDAYIEAVNRHLEKIGLSIGYRYFVERDDGTPTGIIAHAHFYLNDDGCITAVSDCPEFFHPENKLAHLSDFLEVVKVHAGKKLYSFTLKDNLKEKLGQTGRVKI